jgi:ligand-binding sensor domain-containing protein/two-component sensor histidine kinase
MLVAESQVKKNKIGKFYPVSPTAMIWEKKIILCLLAGLMHMPVVFGQYKFEQEVHLNTENGLPVNDIRSIAKAEDGFIWIATSAGLCRFDGKQVKTFLQGKDLRHSILDNTVNCVLPEKNKIWVGTNQGLSVLNTSDYTFRHYQFTNKGKADSLKRRFDQNVNTLYKDYSGNLWIGTSDRGLARYDETKDDFLFYSLPAGKYPPLIPSLGNNIAILNIRASSKNDSIIWAGTAAGLQQINKYTGKVELFTFPRENKNQQVALNAFRRLYYHDDGLLYVGSWAAGVNVFDPMVKTFIPLEVRSEMGKKMVRSVISSILRKSEHEIWISTGLGLVVYNTKEKDVTWYKLNDENELRFYSIRFVDEANRVWCADINGINYFDPALQQFSSYSFRPNWVFAYYIIPDKSGNKITVCPRFSDGTFTFDKLTNRWVKTTFPGNEKFLKETDVIKGFVQLSPGEYVISSDKGIYRYSANNKKISRVQAGFPFGVTRRGDMIADRNGNVWITDNTWGLTKWNPVTGKFINYKNETISADTVGPLNRLMNMYEDSRGNIWFQRQGGIGVYIAAREKIVSFFYSKNENNSLPNAYGFAEDKKGRVWASAIDGWVGYANVNEPEKGIVHKMNIHDKGVSGNLEGLATDTNGEVWGRTLKELVKINSDNLSLSTYDFKYGAKESEFFHFSFLPSGEVVLGGRHEITIANPSELKKNAEIPNPYISEISVLNQPYRNLQKNEPLVLNSKQNFFSISFSSIAYTMPSDVKFRFRLKEFDDWSEPTTRRFANYTNVPGGDYVFQLQAANNEGIWNEQVLELPVRIATPWWQTWWFRVAIGLLIAVLGYWFYRYRIAQIRKKEQIRSQYEKKLANVEMSALLAQMNPHFLFNSLNSIDSYIIRNESKKASEYLNNFARLMRLILQNSRSNYISLKDELESLDLYMQMESLRFANRFEYEIKISPDIDTNAVLIPPMLMQPYVENAIWHGLMHKKDGIQGKVEIIISKKEGNLYCVIQDNGIGREKAEAIKAQKHGNRKRSMGMQITKDRIEMINKLYSTNTTMQVIDLHDEKGNAMGTRVELMIPV